MATNFFNGIVLFSSEAYKVFRDIIESYGGEDAKWDEALLDSARGSQVRISCTVFFETWVVY